jgi:hypothetical protein
MPLNNKLHRRSNVLLTRSRRWLLTGSATVWILLVLVTLLYRSDIDDMPHSWNYFMRTPARPDAMIVGKLASINSKITAEEKKQYAQNLIQLNQTLRERFPYQ